MWFQPWPNELASRRKSTQICKTRTGVRTCEGWPNEHKLNASPKLASTCEGFSSDLGSKSGKRLRRRLYCSNLLYEQRLLQVHLRFSGRKLKFCVLIIHAFVWICAWQLELPHVALGTSIPDYWTLTMYTLRKHCSKYVPLRWMAT